MKYIFLILPVFLFLPMTIFAKTMLLISWAMIGWIMEKFPLIYVSISFLIYSLILGLIAPMTLVGNIFHPIIFLIFSCLLFSKAFQNTKLDEWFLANLLRSDFSTRSSTHIIFVLGLAAYILSMFMSNTAAVALILPVALRVANTISDHSAKKLLMFLSISATLGGLATPIGTPPNLLALDYLNKYFQQNISFLGWMKYALPLSISLFVIAHFLISFLFASKNEPTGKVDLHIRPEKLCLSSKFVFTVLVLMSAYWIAPSFLNVKLPLWYAPVIATVMFYLLSFVLKDKILLNKDIIKADYSVIFIFIAGLTIGTLLDTYGELDTIVAMTKGIDSQLLIFIFLAFAAIILSELGSNTASAAIIFPMVVAFLSKNNPHAIIFLMLISASASMGFSLPLSTPPNAMIYSCGRLKIKEMFRVGILFDLAAFIVICLVAYFIL
jgi:sodium-dependent dicarboxylate transporter 2/3/5